MDQEVPRTMPADPSDNRRRSPRREVMATARVFSADQMHGNFLVQDLSVSGACLVGHLDAEDGARLTLLMVFGRRPPFPVTATVVRHDDTGLARARTAIAFVGLSAQQEDVIQEAVAASLERERARLGANVLVLAPEGQGRALLEDDLRAIGHEPVGISTPLEAVAWLDRPGTRIGVVLVDVSAGAASGLDVLDFLGEHHPRIRRVVIADELRPFRLDLALRSGRAHDVLHKPWSPVQLASALRGEGP
jgi:CheY-like chemotaxis protein